MALRFKLVKAGIWQCPEHPEIQLRRKARTLAARDGRALAGWAVFENGVEVTAITRRATLPEAAGAATEFVAAQRAAAEAAAAREADDRPPFGMTPPAPIAEALARVAAAAREAVEATIVAAMERPAEPDPATEDDVDELVERIVRRAQYQALKVMARVAADWHDGSRSNHQAEAHNTVDDCCAHFELGDILRMVNDAAIELRVPALPDAS